jgi:pyrroloquinoline quinone biosynthesis protein D
MRRPVLARQARYRWDELRRQHQLVFPEGILVLNPSAAAIIQLCDGRSEGDLFEAIGRQYPDAPPIEVAEFLDRLTAKGLLRDADA